MLALSTSTVPKASSLTDRLITEAVALARVGALHELSLREVQRRAGVSPAAAYRHFRDRDALLRAVGDEAAGLLTDRVRKYIAAVRSSRDPLVSARRRLLAQCEGYLDFAFSEPGLYRAVFAAGGEAAELTRPSERARGAGGEGGYNLLVRTFGELATEAGVVASRWDPVVVWSSCHGFAMLRLDGPLQSLSASDLRSAQQRLLESVVGWTLDAGGRA